uniref:isatin hydrolase-like n=1 Tax=Styela clava TaxID=7725 RepID=UPI00193A0A64|nr:isatin hydrolase-like [Styela clava]
MDIYRCMIVFVGIFAICHAKCWPRSNWARLRIDTANVVDLTHEMNETSSLWPTITEYGFKMMDIFKGILTNGPFKFFLYSNYFTTNSLTGTHADAPLQFNELGKSAKDFEMKEMIAPGVVIDLVKDGDPVPRTSFISKADIKAWERKHGRIRSGTIVLFRTGYGQYYWSDRDAYLGTKFRGLDARYVLQTPGIDPEAAKWLLEERCIAAVGIDNYTVDNGQDHGFHTHKVFADANVAVYEDLANLEKLLDKPKGFYVFAMPLKIKNGVGSPARIIAFLQN